MATRTGGRAAKGTKKVAPQLRHVLPPQQVLAPPNVKYDKPISKADLAMCMDVCGAESMGKSHFAATCPGGLGWIETPQEWGKADVIIDKFRTLYNDDKVIKLKRISSFDDIRQTCRALSADDEIRTIIIDSGTHLRPLAGIEWCIEEGKTAVFPTTMWQYPNQKIDQMIAEVRQSKKNLVITNRLHDEWVGETTTGKQIRHGHKPFTYDFHIGFEFVWGIRDRAGKVHCKSHRFGRVYKNAFWGVDEDTLLNYGKPYLFKTTYQGMVEELVEPWGEGVPVQDTLDVCAAQACALFEPEAAKPAVKKTVRGARKT